MVDGQVVGAERHPWARSGAAATMCDRLEHEKMLKVFKIHGPNVPSIDPARGESDPAFVVGKISVTPPWTPENRTNSVIEVRSFFLESRYFSHVEE